MGLHRLWGRGRGSPGSGSPCGAHGSGRRHQPRAGTRSAQRPGSGTRPGTARGQCTVPRSCGWAPGLKQGGGSAFPALCPSWSRENSHPPSPDWAFPMGTGLPMAGTARGAPSQCRLELPGHPRMLQQHPVNHGLSPWCPPKPSGTLSPCHATRLTLAHLGSHQGLLRCPVAQLPAHHAGRGQVPLLVTHGAPLPVAQHLHPALTGMGARSQSHWEHLGMGSRWSVAPGHGHLPAPRARVQTGWPAAARLQDPPSAGWGAGLCQGSPFLGRSCSCPCPCPSGR